MRDRLKTAGVPSQRDIQTIEIMDEGWLVRSY